MDDLSDREFGDYHIIRRIGSGATADVFLAEQRSLGRHVALKILKKDLANDKTHLHRFVREAKAIAALNHPSLVQIYQTDCHDGYWFIAQEYIQGETLQHDIQRSGTVSIRQVVDILWQIASAFETITESGIVHRDIKPENVLLGPNGVVKVTDFGLAHIKTSAEHAQLALTEAGMTLGTPLYMSPEQAQGHKLDHRSDMYSLGITCWHALTGRLPFMGGTALSVALQHVNTSPPSLLKLRPDVPPDLAAIVERMIEKKPENRFQSFYNILQELQAKGLISDKPLLALQSGLARLSARKTLQRALERQRTRWGRIVSLFLFAAILSLLGWYSGYAYRTWINPPYWGEMTQVIPKKSSVEEQWIHACFVNTPDAWNAVPHHFPEEGYFWGREARRQLIRYYYLEDDRENSSPLFQEFALLSDEAGDQMLGFAGLAWCTAEDSPENSQKFLNLIDWSLVYDADGLFHQILDAATKALQRQERQAAGE
jgi:serine/threonine-protein kinase